MENKFSEALSWFGKKIPDCEDCGQESEDNSTLKKSARIIAKENSSLVDFAFSKITYQKDSIYAILEKNRKGEYRCHL